MTEDKLNEILAEKQLFDKLDVKTLVLDLVKHFSDEDITKIFYEKLPELDDNYVKRFLYMTRG